MPLQDAANCRRLLASGETNQPHDPGMRQLADDRELAEILVEGHQDTPFHPGACEHSFVAGRRVVGADPCYVGSPGAKLRDRAAPDASVEQQRYALRSSGRVSNIWCATRRFAYTRQASRSSFSSQG